MQQQMQWGARTGSDVMVWSCPANATTAKNPNQLVKKEQIEDLSLHWWSWLKVDWAWLFMRHRNSERQWKREENQQQDWCNWQFKLPVPEWPYGVIRKEGVWRPIIVQRSRIFHAVLKTCSLDILQQLTYRPFMESVTWMYSERELHKWKWRTDKWVLDDI